jgi:cytochrome c peroxidase
VTVRSGSQKASLERSWNRWRAALVWGVIMFTSAATIPIAPASSLAVEGQDTVIEVGRRLFFDAHLSADEKVSCATCHRPELAFQDGRAVAQGVAGRLGTRNTPSLLDVARQTTLFWDGRRDSLQTQARDPLLNPVEHGLASEADLLSRIRRDAAHTRDFQSAWGVKPADITVEHVSAALAAFQRTLVSGVTPFDRFRANDKAAMSGAAQRGWQLFRGAAQCARCHVPSDDAAPLFTDQRFHSLAVGLRAVERKLPALTARLVKLRSDGRAFDHAMLTDPDIAALGRFALTLDPADIGKFKTPGLRNVALTAPYMHDGSVPSLAEAVDHEIYYRGTQDGRPLILTPAEREDLLAFLHALTSDPTVSAGPPIRGSSAPGRAP